MEGGERWGRTQFLQRNAENYLACDANDSLDVIRIPVMVLFEKFRDKDLAVLQMAKMQGIIVLPFSVLWTKVCDGLYFGTSKWNDL